MQEVEHETLRTGKMAGGFFYSRMRERCLAPKMDVLDVLGGDLM